MERVLAPLSPPHHQAQGGPCTGAAALAMALEALEPSQDPWRDTEDRLHRLAHEPADPPAPPRELLAEELALAALRAGLHARLLRAGPPTALLEAGGLEHAAWEEADHRAQAAGLLVDGGAPNEGRVRWALSAGHPLLLLTDAQRQREADTPRPLWLVFTGLAEDRLRFHDPLAEAGPEEVQLSRLTTLSGFEGDQVMLELATGVGLRR